MATQKVGTFRDPFGKWEDGSTRVVSQLLKNAVEQKAALSRAQNRVDALKASVGNLSGAEAQAAKRLLAEASRELAAAQKEQRRSSLTVNNLQALQRDTVNKLSAIRTWMEGQSLSTADKRKAETVKGLLEKTLTDLSKSNVKDVNFKEIENRLKAIEAHQETLPEELGERFKATEEAMESIKKRQLEAQKFLDEHKKMLRAFGGRILQGMANLGMSLADKIGVGPLTLGNVFRGVGMISRGLAAAGRFAGRVYRGETYGQKYLAARRQAQDPSDESSGLGSNLIDVIKKMGASNVWFQRRLLREVERQGKDKKEGSSSVFSKLGLMLTSLMGSVSKFFGAGGFLKTMASIGRWLAPLAGAARFVLMRAMPVIGAFLGGWKIGSAIYEKYAVQIQDATDAVIGALRGAYDWVASKIGGVKEWAGSTYQKGRDAVVGGASSLYGKALGAASTISSAVTGAATAVGDIGRSAVSNVQSAATNVAGAAVSAGTGALRAGEAAGSYISKGVSKLSSLVGSVITKGPNANLDDLNPAMQSSLGMMAQDYFIATGRRLQFNSGHRDDAEQERLYKSMPAGMAARPGSSLHNYGLAVDLQSSQANELQKLGLLDKYGLTRPISKEPWHVQPKGVSVAAARSGIYSADAPSNQTSLGTAVPASQAISQTTGQPTTGGAPGSVTPPSVVKIGKQTSGSRPVGLNDIPTHDMSNGLFVALNLGVLG